MAKWVQDMLVRAFKTALQTFVGSLTAVCAISDIEWPMVVISTAGAFVMSLFMSLAAHFNIELEDD